jgi:hypothetical protein
MTRLVNNSINSLVQVVDSNGDKVTDAVVNYKVYFYDYDDDEVWEVAQSGLMTHIGDGLYQAEWTPNFYGEYVFYAYSSNPKFHESYTYFIEDANVGSKYVWVHKPIQFTDIQLPVVQNTWYPILSESGGVRGLYLTVVQQNNEAEAKNIEFEITVDGEIHSTTINAQNLHYHSVALGIDDDYNLMSCVHDSFPGYMMMGRTYYGNGIILTVPLECRSLAVRIRMISAVGTNQALQGRCAYDKLESV